MITRLKLLQTKYSLSNEFIISAIRAEIERQALLDIKGIISNCSVTGLEAAVSEFNVTDPMAKAIVASNGESDEPLVVALATVPASKTKGKRRG